MKFIKNYILLGLLLCTGLQLMASSHREAPLIANDPLADNVDVYAFRSPDNPNTITMIATYVPLQLPHGGPNYYSFGTDVRYEIRVDNDASKPGDEIIYRFTFSQVNEDPTTFFNIRLGKQNLKTTYKMERSTDGGMSFSTVISEGVVPPPNIGPRSIESPVGLGSNYADLMAGAITTTGDGEKVFAGTTDDPFFVDLGGIFDLGDAPRQMGRPRDGLACYNVSAIAIQVPISMLLKDGAATSPKNILDSDYVIGVWANASRKKVRTLSAGASDSSGDWVQVSRLGMPLTNEAVIAIGDKDYWNAISPHDEITDTRLDPYFYNPELALYMDDDQFGGAVPAFSPLRIQEASLGAFDFTNGADGLFGLKGSDAVAGTALDDAVFGTLLLPGPGMPRSVDLWPTFHTGVPNVVPYQLATGKGGNPLAPGKPFINNFLPNGGDMLRLNMATPVTPRDSDSFSSLGLIQAAVLGLTDPQFANTDIQAIPNMDGFPNGRRLEDDVTRIELQAVGGIVLAAIGLWYDDFVPGESPSPVTQDLLDVLTYTTGVEKNDKAFRSAFPYIALPFSGTGPCSGPLADPNADKVDLALSVKEGNTLYNQFEEVPFTITVTNTGAVDANGVSVSAPLPEGLVFTSASASKGGYDLVNSIYNVGSLAAGESATLNITLFTLVGGQDLTYFAQVATASPLDVDSTPGNDTDQTPDEDDEDAATITPADDGGVGTGEGNADLSLSIDVDDSNFEIYTNVTYTISITNDGPDAATNVAVHAGLVDGLVFTSASTSTGEYNLFKERWTVPSLASGDRATLSLVLFTLKEGSISNYVQVLSADQNDPDSTPGNGTFGSPAEDDEVATTISSDAFNGGASSRNASLEVKGIFPVPALTTLNVNLTADTDQRVEIQVYDMLGKQVLSQNTSLNSGFNQFSIDVSKLSQGAYMIVVPMKGGGAIQEKFIKAAF